MPGKMVFIMTQTANSNVINWDNMTTAELARGVELMITPDDLTIREVAIAIFTAFGYDPADVQEIITSGEYLNAGAVFSGLDTDHPQIINNTARE